MRQSCTIGDAFIRICSVCGICACVCNLSGNRCTVKTDLINMPHENWNNFPPWLRTQETDEKLFPIDSDVNPKYCGEWCRGHCETKNLHLKSHRPIHMDFGDTSESEIFRRESSIWKLGNFDMMRTVWPKSTNDSTTINDRQTEKPTYSWFTGCLLYTHRVLIWETLFS